MIRLKRAFFLLLGSLLMAGAAWAQVTDRGSITGIISDQTGAVIPDVAITVTNKATGVANSVTTNEAGVYTVPSLPPAVYQLTAEKTGFKKYERTSLLVQIGQPTRLDFALAVGHTTEVVQVTGTAPLLERENTDTGAQFNSRQVEDLPLQGNAEGRTPAVFMQLAPGVTGKGSSQGGGGMPRTMSTSVSGSAVSSTSIALDGADIPSFNEFEGDLRGLQIPPDALSEFKLQATNGAAEYGRSGGGTAIFEVKSGTNQIHGSVYEYLRNDALNAVPWFNNALDHSCEGHACRAPYKQNEWGFTAGGPIKKDKAFIFGYYDGFKLVRAATGGTVTIPTQQMLQGDFTNYPRPLYDPSLAVQTNAIGAPVCGPIICDTRNWVSDGNGGLKIASPGGAATVNSADFDRVSKLVIPLIPQPTIADPTVVSNNFLYNTKNPTSLYEYGFKGDYNFNAKNRINVYYGVGQTSTPNHPGIPAPLGGGDIPSINYTRNIRLNYNMTPAANVTNQLTLALNEWNSGTQPPGTWAGKSDWVSYLGIKGVAANYPTQFPQIVINGVSWDGGGGPAKNNQHSSIINDTLTWIKGRHTAKFGFQYMKGASNNLNATGAGYFNYTNNQTGLATDFTPAGCTSNSCKVLATNTGIAAASFLLGYANEGRVTVTTAPSYPRNAYYAGFAQDDFKFTRKLTFNLGLRYDLYIPDYQKYNTKSWIDYSVPNPTAKGYMGALVTATPADRSGLNTYKKNFSPRVGLAYALDDKTVIRAAYAIIFSQGNANRLDRGSFIQGYNGTVGSTTTTLEPGFIWGTETLPTFTPSLDPSSQNGRGTPKHSAGTLIAQDRTDSLPPYMNQWTFNIQRQLPGQMILTTAYVGNLGVHISSRITPWNKLQDKYLPFGAQLASDGTTSLLLAPITDPNVQASAPIQALPVFNGVHVPYANFLSDMGYVSSTNFGAATMGQALKTSPQFQGTHRYYEGVGNSTYNALQVKLEKHFSNGLQLLVSYAWSKTLTDGGSIFSTFSSNFGGDTPWNARLQKTYSFIDLPNLLSISYVYDLPVGKGKPFLNRGGVANAILGGWRYSGIIQYQSGAPQEIEVGGRPGFTDQGWGRAIQILGVPMGTGVTNSTYDPFSSDPKINSQLNPAAFAAPPYYQYGTITPNEATVRTFGWLNEDMSLLKEWPIHESISLTFRADFFNIFNRRVFGENNGAYSNEPTVGDPSFGKFGSTVNDPRAIQFGLKVRW